MYSVHSSPCIVRSLPPQTLPEVNILVVNDTAPSIVYMDVLSNGLGKARVLRQSSQFDVATCGEAADVNLDGELEVCRQISRPRLDP